MAAEKQSWSGCYLLSNHDGDPEVGDINRGSFLRTAAVGGYLPWAISYLT